MGIILVVNRSEGAMPIYCGSRNHYMLERAQLKGRRFKGYLKHAGEGSRGKVLLEGKQNLNHYSNG
jgi:hypothetical protein